MDVLPIDLSRRVKERRWSSFVVAVVRADLELEALVTAGARRRASGASFVHAVRPVPP